MKIRISLALLCGAALVAPIFSPVAHAQKDDAYKRSWKGVATLKTLSKKEKIRELKASYPIFSGHRKVAQVAGLKLKTDAIQGFNAFEKESRGSAQELGLPGGMTYAYNLETTLVLNRPQFISATTQFYQFTGGAHGIYGTFGTNFGVPAGQNKPRQLKLADFFTDGVAASRRVNNLLMNKLRATKGREQEATWVIEGEVKSVSKTSLENFVAEKDGLRWFFGPYEMGPYAAGEFEVKLTARELGPKFRASLLR